MSRPKQEGLREQILDVALDRFIDKGFHETTISEIADQAGIAAGSVYNHFKGKEELYDAAVRRGWDRILDVLRSARDPRLSPADNLRGVNLRLSGSWSKRSN